MRAGIVPAGNGGSVGSSSAETGASPGSSAEWVKQLLAENEGFREILRTIAARPISQATLRVWAGGRVSQFY